ncbi:3-deoxy-8-phosphooctulonate synthase [bacterium]|nr:3-deoxy-8-phosphooctulonate synthase [bacterium]
MQSPSSRREQTVAELRSHCAEVSRSPNAPLPAKPFLFSGPCQLESRDHALRLAEEILRAAEQYNFHYIFKASFDKANRTSKDGVRGIGLEEAIPIFREIQSQLDVPILTDIHLPSHPSDLGNAVDILQIPAFLCRQTDLLTAAGASGQVINLKKGQFVHPQDLQYAAEKIRAANSAAPVLLCERGTCFGYRDLVVDMRGLIQMRSLGYPVIFDGSHVVQIMSGEGGKSGGDSRYSAPLCRAAIAVGVDGIFLETHENPRSAPSDGDSMLPLSELPALLASLRKGYHAVSEEEVGFL